MKKLINTLLLLMPLLVSSQTFIHNRVREDALSNPDFYSDLWIPEKGVYKITLMVPEEEQLVTDVIPNEVIIPEIDTQQVMLMQDPMMPEIDTTGMWMYQPEPAIVEIPQIPQPVLMPEYIKVLKYTIGNENTLALMDTTYWIVVDGNKTASLSLKPTLKEELGCCYLIYEWIIELNPEQYFQIWHKDRIKDFELGDYVTERDQYFSELSPGERIPDYYKGLILKVTGLK